MSNSGPGPLLRVLAGPSTSELVDISDLVNTGESHSIESDRFSGSIAVYIKGFPNSSKSEYFEHPDRKNVTWSIQTQGRFLQTYSSDDVLFGNSFDRPLKLPWGSGAALKFMQYVKQASSPLISMTDSKQYSLIDPSLQHDLGGPRPWALSPLVTTMPHLQFTELPSKDAPLPKFPPPPSDPIKEDSKTLSKRITERRQSVLQPKKNSNSILSLNRRNNSIYELDEVLFEKPSKRRQFFSQIKNRRLVDFTPKDVITTDFCYGFLSFPSLALNLPGGISFDLKKYWDGQPVRFVCVERQPERSSDEEEGDDNSDVSEDDDRMFWCVVIIEA
ncbi:hypothetical protein Clacol_009191 [Clathrus columnatus]|uniref:Domain of unknown function at the cortex 1 domain-containing protein n=1 Tax=Clathrus columnatus TaxID=1419009 RepID=A0AAV5APV5_9AGAM|nr:hypothetical protein Clacol_009191 [Clathrus columnatus]